MRFGGKSKNGFFPNVENILRKVGIIMAGLWKNDPKIKGGKYLVTRRDGTNPAWPHFVLGARDPAAPAALRAYADAAEKSPTYTFDPKYIAEIRAMADEFEDYLKTHGEGDPSAPRHRVDDPATVAKMLTCKGA